MYELRLVECSGRNLDSGPKYFLYSRTAEMATEERLLWKTLLKHEMMLKKQTGVHCVETDGVTAPMALHVGTLLNLASQRTYPRNWNIQKKRREFRSNITVFHQGPSMPL
ncbi:hypothetical protein EVAR_13632_1 [Eumeta japonica]|uniref:Uncharacterized protein n=1 Tax=Eumeta variegata TaxID=151549 RepID=A0A4C1UTT7_EUMVA|nr:hypothetical protein EVAR_13632_1 [Eumeta japonica]